MSSPEYSPLNEDDKSFVEKYIAYAQGVAYRFYNERPNIGIDPDECESAALMALCQAAARYRDDEGVSFKTYSYRRLRGSIIDELRRKRGVPRSSYSRQSDCDSEDDDTREDREKEYSFKCSRPPWLYAHNALEFAALTSVIEELGLKVRAGAERNSADLEYADDLNPEEISVLRNCKELIKSQIKALPERERRMIELRYYSDMTLDQMRPFFNGVSRAWLSRVHSKALKMLREAFVKKIYEGAIPSRFGTLQ